MRKGTIAVWEVQTIEGKRQIVDIPVKFANATDCKLALGWYNGGGSMEKKCFDMAMDEMRHITGIRDYQALAFAFARGYLFSKTLDVRRFSDSVKGV